MEHAIAEAIEAPILSYHNQRKSVDEASIMFLRSFVGDILYNCLTWHKWVALAMGGTIKVYASYPNSETEKDLALRSHLDTMITDVYNVYIEIQQDYNFRDRDIALYSGVGGTMKVSAEGKVTADGCDNWEINK